MIGPTRTAVVFVLSLFAHGQALAHAALKHSQPAAGATVKTAPSAVTLDFSEGVVPKLSSVAVRDDAAKSVKTGKPMQGGSAASLSVSIDQTLSPGAYSVNWRVVSVDTHRSQGSFRFTVAP